MSKTNIHIDPLTTNCMLKNLSLAIDEIKLVRSIDNLTEQVRQNPVGSLEPSRKHYLVSELRFLNKRLRSVREKASSH